jgi:F-type H+-transporting ATPase subunit epsilon
MGNIKIEVLQPHQIKVKNQYDHVIVPGIEGDFGVAEEHTPFITKVRPGILKLYKGNEEERYAIHDGFVTVENNVIKIVCENIEKEDEIDIARAEASKARAEKRLRTSEGEIDYRRAEIALKKALVRLKIVNR